jgi:hypothetical protein
VRSSELNYVSVLFGYVKTSSYCRLSLVVIDCCIEVGPISHIQKANCELTRQIRDFGVGGL